MARQGVTRALVVDEAVAIVHQQGFDALTLAALARRLDIRVPSLYSHIASLDEVRSAVSFRAARLLADRMGEAAMGRAGRDALIAIAAAYRGFAAAAPGLYQATLRSPSTPEDAAPYTDIMSIINAVLSGYGLVGAEAVDAARSLRALLHGWISLEAAGAFNLDRDAGASFASALDSFDAVLTSKARVGGATVLPFRPPGE